MTDFSKTLMRCSSIGAIMTDPRGMITEKQLLQIHELQDKAKFKPLTTIQEEKLDELIEKRDLGVQLSNSCKKYLIRTYAIEKYHRQPDILTKQMVKGITAEEVAIDLFNLVEGRIYGKNTKRLNNDYISGTPDLFDGPELTESEQVIDLKCSWDIMTFLNNIANPFNKMYYWQLQGYMALSGATRGTLAYCLVNTPEEMINSEKYKLFNNMQCVTEESPAYILAAAKLEFNMKFDDIPPEERILKFYIDRNDEDIARIYQKVVKCREFLMEFEDQHKFFTKDQRREARKLLSLQQIESE